jgi:hypothetical protein
MLSQIELEQQRKLKLQGIQETRCYAPATLRHVKIGTRGLAKNRAQIFTLFALGNLFLMRVRLTA